ncbi:hypothetical protein NLU13_3932 [Sarocladium strictum]|uniref:Uncharacterized protein n=1 Tax=Sarocladium strictum TaxID=5046 RepID=A0AA39GKH3_SARSR|nr:hypothetical protein NLU13_3932 [Sarocladium strictum]
MYVVRGFSNRRKSAPKSPRNLHIRKISLSGCSVGSWDSSSSTCSSAATPTMPTFSPTRIESAITARSSFENNPLGSHPSHQAPLRLSQRAFLQPDHRGTFGSSHMSSSGMGSTFFHDDTEDEDDFTGYGYSESDSDTMELPLHEEQPKHMELPPAASPLDHTANERVQPQDYFLYQLGKRPPMPRSHWSESTIQTLVSFDDLDDLDSGICTPADEIDLTEVDISTAESSSDELQAPVVGIAETVVILPNFSYKRSTAPQRPSVQVTVDKVEEVSKTGGWKRRGVVFNKNEAGEASEAAEKEVEAEE